MKKFARILLWSVVLSLLPLAAFAADNEEEASMTSAHTSLISCK